MSFQLKFANIALAIVGPASLLLCQLRMTAQATAPNSPQQGQPAVLQAEPTQIPGSINGTVVDQSGALVAGAKVVLGSQQIPTRDVLSNADGQFSFIDVPPGPFQLTITATGFASKTFSGTLQPGEIDSLPQIVLAVPVNKTEVQVGVSQTEVATEQIKIEEKQRVLGVVPNFYVSYIPNAAPLNAKQKFQLATRTLIDPVTFVVVGGTAGVQQAQDHFREYGEGAEGYAKRFGAGYADSVTSTLIGGAILPSVLKQDPRYFYKGTGSTTSRARYAVANAVICKGDNGRWQPNYSFILGSLAAGGISNLYYPQEDRGVELTFENVGVGIAQAAFTNLLQEFVIRKLTPKTPRNDPNHP